MLSNYENRRKYREPRSHSRHQNYPEPQDTANDPAVTCQPIYQVFLIWSTRPIFPLRPPLPRFACAGPAPRGTGRRSHADDARRRHTQTKAMPKRTDLQSILILGSGPIVIGQAAEFDYSGTQAVRALREEGYRVILVNSNPATIMTDPDLADATYIEPITPEWVERVIELERPDAILPTMGGQTALNVALELFD